MRVCVGLRFGHIFVIFYGIASILLATFNFFVRNELLELRRPQVKADAESMGYAANSLQPQRDYVTTNATGDIDKNKGTLLDVHPLGGLDCADHGGPTARVAVDDMIYWSDLPADSTYKSPFSRDKGSRKQYLTFEQDDAGFNNMRSSMEVIVVLAHATGRTLVLPPKQKINMLGGKNGGEEGWSLNDFFHLDLLAKQHEGINIISTEEYLRERTASSTADADNLPPPPQGRINWDHASKEERKLLASYLREHSIIPQEWDPTECVLGIPSSRGQYGLDELREAMETVAQMKPEADYEVPWDPPPKDPSVEYRLREILGGRKKMCLYNERLQEAPVLHIPRDKSDETYFRLLTHWYAFLFFQDHETDLYYKRFVRDNIRLHDELQCAAGRIVAELRQKAREMGDKDGRFHTMHIRRGDFLEWFPITGLSAKELYETSKAELEKLPDVRVLFIATDHREKAFFDPFRKKYHVFFLDDFDDIANLSDKRFGGMVDQLIAAKGEVFWGTFWSTFSGYINRLRGYHATRAELPGAERGELNSFYFSPEHKINQMRQYMPVKLPLFMRDFPTSWINLEKDNSKGKTWR